MTCPLRCVVIAKRPDYFCSKSRRRNPRMIKQSRRNEWNLTWESPLLSRLFSMNENSNENLTQQDEAENFTAWLKRNRLDNGQPWLFYGEDELFEDVIWTLERSAEIQDWNQRSTIKLNPMHQLYFYWLKQFFGSVARTNTQISIIQAFSKKDELLM